MPPAPVPKKDRKISQDQIDSVSNYLLKSILPSNEVQGVVSLLNKLPVVDVTGEIENKDEPKL